MPEEHVRVLLLDDEESLRKPLQRFLEKEFGYHVDAVASGTEALEQVIEADGLYDVALIDEVLMPGPDGIAVMEQIKARYPDIECIVFTGWGAEPRERALRAGAFRYLEKPFNSEELAMLIRTAAQQVRLRAISRTILSEKDPERILESIARAACSLAMADESSIALLDLATGRITVHAKVGPGKQEWRKHFKKQALSTEIIRTGQMVYIPDTMLDERVAPVVIESGIRSFVGIPIPGERGNLGVLYVYSSEANDFDDWGTISVLQTLAGQAGLAITNARAFQRIQAHARYMEALVKAGQGLTRAIHLEEQLELVWDFVREQLGMDTFFVALYDERTDRLHFPLAYDKGQRISIPDRYLGSDMGKWGVAGYVAKTGEGVYAPTQARLTELCRRLGIQAIPVGAPCQTCFYLPLKVGPKVIGVFSIQSYHPYAFEPELLDACRALGSHLAVAMENARRVEELEQMRQAAEAMSRAIEPRRALQQIVKSAVQVLQAHSAVIWSYDEARDVSIPEELTAEGIPPEELDRLREDKIKPGRTAETVMQEEYMLVEDISRPEYAFLGPTTRSTLNRIGVQSFQGIALRVGDERLGVLYVNYTHPRAFGNEDQKKLQTFASHAALALKNARLMAQLQRTREAAGTIAGVTVQENLKQTLETVARHTREALGCDAVNIYAYDEAEARFTEYAAEMINPYDPDSARPPDQLTPDSVTWSILNLPEPFYHLAEDGAPADPLFSGHFVRAEKIRAAMGVQLRVSDRKMGVMFVNFRSPHRFTSDEIATVRLFADQAAVAIRNAQLYQKMMRRMETLQALYDAGQAITGALTLQEVLDRIAIQARRLVGGLPEEGCFSHLALVEGHILYFAAACAPGILARLREKVGDIDLEHSPRIGITGRAVKTGQSQVVGDVLTDPDYICFDPRTRSELAVPIQFGRQVIGIINVEHPSPNTFGPDEQRALESLAAQAAIAIRNARQSELQQAVYEASKVISVGITAERQKLLQHILEQAATRIRWPQRPKAILGLIQRYDPEAHAIFLESVYPSDHFPRLMERLGEKRSLDRTEERRIGISGRTVLTGHIQRVDDVRMDPDYVELHPETLSELDVPLRLGDRVLGVLSLESDRLAAFDEIDEAALQSLADLAAIVMENARQYEELKRTQGLVGSRTAVAWMGMTSSIWRHAIEKHAITIRDTSRLLRADLQKGSPSPSHIQERLDTIERMATQILEKPIVPPLSGDAVEPVFPNDLIGERARRLWQNHPYREVKLHLDLQLPPSVIVRVSPDWLRYAFDILVDNAIEAMVECEVREITISTRKAKEGAEIRVSDTGCGIPEEIRAKIGLEPIEKPDGACGLGMGLLIAQTIVQAYGGELRVESTGPTGTTMVVWLPAVEE